MPGGGSYFPYVGIQKTLKIFLSETTGPISIYFGRNVALVTFHQDCSSYHDFSKKPGHQGEMGGCGAYFSYISI